MNIDKSIPLVLIPSSATISFRGGLSLFIDRLIRHCTDRGFRVRRLIIPAWFEYLLVWPGLKAGQLLSRGLGTTWALLYRGIYTTCALWLRYLLTRERAICFTTEPALLSFVGWPKQLCLIGVYSEGPTSKEEAVRGGVWRTIGRQRLGIRLLMAAERRSCLRAARIVADSPAGWKAMVSIFDLPLAKGQVVWQAIDTLEAPGAVRDRRALRAQLEWPDETTVAIFTGQLYGIKGVDILFEAIRLQPDDRLRLVVLGTGVLETSLRSACRSDQILRRRVHMAGYQSDVYYYLRGADIFVLPSRQEGTSTSLLEALSIGLAAVGSDVGGIHDVIKAGECGVLVPPDDPMALATALRELMVHPHRRTEFGRRGREFVLRHCCAEDMAARYIKLFQELAFADIQHRLNK
jgi:glycosyltransferase involved in cell wall biosynthesis